MTVSSTLMGQSGTELHRDETYCSPISPSLMTCESTGFSAPWHHPNLQELVEPVIAEEDLEGEDNGRHVDGGMKDDALVHLEHACL